MSTNSIKEGVTLKSLQSRLEKEKAENSVIQKQINELKEKSKAHNQRITSILAQINNLAKEDLVMTEHAKIRFLERVELIPVEEIESRVITEELRRMVGILGNGEFPIGIGEHTCIVKGGFITTIK
jgi:seryl-tRNA synthetase